MPSTIPLRERAVRRASDSSANARKRPLPLPVMWTGCPAVGVVMGGLAFVLGFGMVWHIWWLVIVCGLAMWVALILRASDDESEFMLPAKEVARLEDARYRALGSMI